jgi:hypothetical protein
MVRLMMRLLAAPALIAAAQTPTTFTFAEFVSLEGVTLQGSAAGWGKALRLTPATAQQTGAAWFAEKQALRGGFETTFQFQLTQQGGLSGADGFAFVIQNTGPAALAGRGSAAGFAMGDGQRDWKVPGIPSSIAVFFDTYRNEEDRDPSDNYIVICTNCQLPEMRWPPAKLAMVRKLKTDMKDRRVHTARIIYKPPVMTVFLDNLSVPVLSSTVDLSMVLDGGGSAWVGFTSSTGNGWENHDILSWSFTGGPKPDVRSNMSVVSSNISFVLSACLPDRNLCTPDHPIVEEKGPGLYHVVLPANLEWGASVPNATGRAVTVRDVRGTVCWDHKARGAEGCRGPASEGPGALLQRTRDGRTYFSISDQPGAFRDNEGYFEFDVEVR